MLHKIKDIVLTLSPLIILLIFWEISVSQSSKAQFLFGAPSLVFETAIQEYANISIWNDIGVTTLEVILGLIVGSILGVSLGLLMWSSGRFERIVKPYIIALGSIPVFALAPILIIWFGIGLLSKIIMAAFAVFLITTVQAYEGAKAAADEHLFFAKSLGAKQSDIVRKIILPASMRWILVGIKINIGMAVLGAFIAEFVNAQAGLGHYILKAGSLYDIPGVIFGIINLSVLALFLDKAAHFIFQPKRKPLI